MAGQGFISLENGKYKELYSAQISSGVSSAGKIVALNSSGLIDTTMLPPIGGGTVTTVSVVSANGFSGTVANASTTPTITLATTITGVLKGSGSALAAATASDITGQLLTGYVSSSGTITASDTILTAIEKLNGNISAGYVPYTGASADLNLGAHNFYANNITANVISHYSSASNTFLVGDSGLIQYRTAANVLSDIGATPTSRTLTINSVTYDLSANRSWTIATGSGTVTSVAMTVPTGLSISGSPITTAGTLALTLTSGYVIPTTTEETNWNTAYTNRITSLTTTGSSGAATLLSNTLNIPNYTIDGILPSQTGNNGKYLTTNGTSASWATVSASAAGSNTQVQYNSSGAFAGSANMVFDGNKLTVNQLSVSGARTTAAWSTTGVGLNTLASTYTDNSSTGTNAISAINVFASPTIATSNNSVTYKDVATLYVSGAPISGTNSPTFTYKWSSWFKGSGTTSFNNVRIGDQLHVGADMYASNYQPSIVVYASYQNSSGYSTGIDFTTSSYSYNSGGTAYSLGSANARLQYQAQGVAYGSGNILDMVVSSVFGGGTLKPFIRCSSGYSAGGGVLSSAPNFIQNYYPTYIGTTDVYPTSSLTVGGSLGLKYTAVTANYPLTATDCVVLFNGTSLTATIPSASSVTGRLYIIANRNATTLTTSAYLNLSGASTTTVLAMTSIMIISDGTNWQQIQ